MVKIIAYNNECVLPTILPSQKIIYVQLLYKNCKKEYIESIIKKVKEKFGFLNKIIDILQINLHMWKILIMNQKSNSQK